MNIPFFSKSRPKHDPSINRHTNTKDKERAAAVPAYIKLNKFLPVTAQVCEPLCSLTSVKAKWVWNKTKIYMSEQKQQSKQTNA